MSSILTPRRLNQNSCREGVELLPLTVENELRSQQFGKRYFVTNETLGYATVSIDG